MKLPRLGADNRRRAEIAARYCAEIRNPAVRLPTNPNPAELTCGFLPHVFHIFTVFCDRREDLQRHLAANGIQTVIHYPIPPHRQPAYTEWHGLSLPVTEKIHETELSLPISPVLTDAEVASVIAAVNAF